MNQPILGQTIVELRNQKGFTQEELAEFCEVSTRTIQRIESGEVMPRSYTINNLSNILEFDFNEDVNQYEHLWLALLHISSIFAVVIIPIVLWGWKKKQSLKINNQGKKAINFQITVIIMIVAALLFFATIVGGILLIDKNGGTSELMYAAIVVCGILPLIGVGIFSSIQGVLNTFRSLSDKPIKYRLSIPFIK